MPADPFAHVVGIGTTTPSTGRAIDAAYAVDEVKAIHDQAAMLQAAARVAGNIEAEDRCYQIRWRAAKKGGAISKALPKIVGDIQSPHNRGTEPKGKVLENAGISSQEASRWERLSEIPEDKFEAALAQKSIRDLIRLRVPTLTAPCNRHRSL